MAAIVQSPHAKDPGKIFKILEENDPPSPQKANETATQGIERLKLALSQNPRFIVK